MKFIDKTWKNKYKNADKLLLQNKTFYANKYKNIL